MDLEDEEVVLAVGFYKIILLDEAIAGLCSFLDHNILLDAMILAIAVAIDNADRRATSKRLAQVLQQEDRRCDFVVGLEYQNGIHAVRRQLRIVRSAQDGTNGAHSFFAYPLVYVFDRFGIDVHGIDSTVLPNAFCRPHSEPARAGSDISNTASGVNIKNVHHPLDLYVLVTNRILED